MSPLKILLFGKFRLIQNDVELECLSSAKAKELLCYLLLHKDRPHAREILASLLWGDCTTAQSRKYFRQTLWQLQQWLREVSPTGKVQALEVEGESLGFNSQSDLFVDIIAFEQAFAPVRGIIGEEMDTRQWHGLKEAVSLYGGDLLEGWYQDWCLYHRERLQNTYLAMMDKLMGYCESHQDYEAGLAYGERLLGQDRGRERTYLRMMRLHYLAGDRAGAIRQFQRCVAALEEELNVKPSKRTLDLYEQIRTDELKPGPFGQIGSNGWRPERVPLASLGSRLRKLRSVLLKVNKRVQQDIREVDQALGAKLSRPRQGR